MRTRTIIAVAIVLILFSVNCDTVNFPNTIVCDSTGRKLLQVTPIPTPTSTPSPTSPGWNAPWNGTVCWDGSPRKSKLAVFLLSFFAGGLAVDRFYTGYIVIIFFITKY